MTDRFEETFETLLGSVKDKSEKVEDESYAPHVGADTLPSESLPEVEDDSRAESASIVTTTEGDSADTEISGEGGAPSFVDASTSDVEHFVKLAKGAFLVPNYVSDYLMKNLSLGEQSVFIRLYRLSRGFHRKTEPITVRNLAESCGLNPKLTANIIKALASKRLLKIIYSNPFTKKVKFKLVLPREVEQKMVVCGVCHNLITEEEEWKYYPITVPVSGKSQAIAAHVDCVEGSPFLDGSPIEDA